MSRLRDAVPRSQNKFESVFYLYCTRESYTGFKNEVLEQNPIQRMLHFHSGIFLLLLRATAVN